MLSIQSNPQVYGARSVAFKSTEDDIKMRDEWKQQQDELNKLADEFQKEGSSKSDKVSNGLSKVIRVAAQAIGVVVAFAGMKVSMNKAFEKLTALLDKKVVQEGIKKTKDVVNQAVNSESGQKVVQAVNEYGSKAAEAIKGAAANGAEKVKNSGFTKKLGEWISGGLDKLKKSKFANSKVGIKIRAYVKLASKKVGAWASKFFAAAKDGAKSKAEVLSEKLHSVTGENIKNAVVNTVSGGASAAILIDNIEGRNDDKSNAELITEAVVGGMAV